jgi:hypothetical protein
LEQYSHKQARQSATNAVFRPTIYCHRLYKLAKKLVVLSVVGVVALIPLTHRMQAREDYACMTSPDSTRCLDVLSSLPWHSIKDHRIQAIHVNAMAYHASRQDCICSTLQSTLIKALQRSGHLVGRSSASEFEYLNRCETAPLETWDYVRL